MIRAVTGLVLATLLAAPVRRPPPRAQVLARARGRFGPIYVVERGGLRALRFGHPGAEDQSLFDPAHPAREPLEYIRAALLGLAYTPRGRTRPRTLVVGLGGGSYLRHLRRLRPRARLEAVEIDPVVVRLARRWFALGRVTGLKVHVGDGRRFLTRRGPRYDLVFLDAYDDDDYPAHLGTLAFFRQVRARLAPGGVVVANLSPNRPRDRDDLVRTFRAVFPRARCLSTPREGNTVVLGGPGVARLPAATAVARVAALARRAGAGLDLQTLYRGQCRFSLRAARIRRDPARHRPTRRP